jgi:hypothetical protein
MRKHSGNGMKLLTHFPRLTTIALSYVAAFLVFGLLGEQFFHDALAPFGLAGAFIAGALYTFSFTSSIGALLLVALVPYYPAGVIAVIGGIGALAADVFIFNFIRHNLDKEVERVSRSALVCRVGAKGLFCTRWFRALLGFLVIASPLPDELGAALLSAAKMKSGDFTLIAFIADILGIYALVSAFSFLS